VGLYYRGFFLSNSNEWTRISPITLREGSSDRHQFTLDLVMSGGYSVIADTTLEPWASRAWIGYARLMRESSDVMLKREISALEPGLGLNVEPRAWQRRIDVADSRYPQRFTITAADDDDHYDSYVIYGHRIKEQPHSHVSGLLHFRVIDDDAPHLLYASTTADTPGKTLEPRVHVDNGGSFAVRLGTNPLKEVTLRLSSSDPNALSITGGGTLTFNQNNWQTLQNVTLSSPLGSLLAKQPVTITVQAEGYTKTGAGSGPYQLNAVVTADGLDSPIEVEDPVEIEVQIVEHENVNLELRTVEAPALRHQFSLATSITVSWDAVEGARDYVVHYWEQGKRKRTKQQQTAYGAAHTLTDLKPDTTYTIRLYVHFDQKVLFKGKKAKRLITPSLKVRTASE